MPQPATPVVAATDFQGIVTAQDPRDLDPGTAELQVNIASAVMGELRVRLGMQEVSFSSD